MGFQGGENERLYLFCRHQSHLFKTSQLAYSKHAFQNRYLLEIANYLVPNISFTDRHSVHFEFFLNIVIQFCD